jgi:hypothetical protein
MRRFNGRVVAFSWQSFRFVTAIRPGKPQRRHRRVGALPDNGPVPLYFRLYGVTVRFILVAPIGSAHRTGPIIERPGK